MHLDLINPTRKFWCCAFLPRHHLSHQAVMAELATVIADGNILRLVEKFLKAGVTLLSQQYR
jgi:hypothetical protein